MVMNPAYTHPNRRRHQLRTAVGLVALGLGLAACAPSEYVNADPDRGWLPASSPKELEVERASYRHAVHFDTDSAVLTAGERGRLLAFLDSVTPTDRDSLHLEGHADERASELYNVELAMRRNESVATFLAELGLVDVAVSTNAYGEAVPADGGSGPDAWRRNRRVELVLERYLVTLPACPDWSRRSGLDFDNLPMSNLGCATTTNLGLMVAEPKDLVRGRPLDRADGIHQAEGIVRYRTGKVVELEEERVEQ
jgi:pilus assembly protein CpaD